MIATTLVQSRHLLELGLDPKTADCHYKDIGNVGEHYKLEVGGLVGNNDIPAWSLSALLEVMPNNDYWDIYLCQAQDGKWQSVWNDCEISNGEAKDFIADTPIDATYEMVCWLLEQKILTFNNNEKD